MDIHFVLALNYHKLQEQIVKLKSLLRQNGYPTRFLDKMTSKFFDRSFKKQVSITAVPKKTIHLVLTYLGTVFENEDKTEQII